LQSKEKGKQPMERIFDLYQSHPGYLTVLVGLLGMAVGSFLGVVADRVPRGRSIVFPPSSCDSCGRRLAARDLFPVFGYLWNKGRCRYCRTKVPLSYPLLEAVTGIIFAFMTWQLGLDGELAVGLLLASLLIVCTVTDLQERLIPNVVVLTGAVLLLVVRLFVHPMPIWNYGLAFFIGGGLLLLAAWLGYLLMRKEGMGGGDIKLFAVIGLALGAGPVLLAVFLSALFGLAGSILLSLLNRNRPGGEIPFAPYIAAAAFISYLWGDRLIGMYFDMIGLS
jgi:leader peptidase (prepilin peptidase)/N-methyltransferase